MIYLDYQATTPLAPEAREAVLRWLDGPGGIGFGNPHSAHRLGRQAEAAVEAARERVAALFPPGGMVVFTSGAAEALNLALRGVRAGTGRAGRWRSARSSIRRCSTPRSTCPATPRSCPWTATAWSIRKSRCPKASGMVSVMQVNNEIGTVQPVADLYQRAKARGALFVCDAVAGRGQDARSPRPT